MQWGGGRHAAGALNVLRTRVLTALAIAAVLLPAIFLLDRLAWSVATAAIAGIAGWEFGRLAKFCKAGQLRYGVFMFALSMAGALLLPPDRFNALAMPVLAVSAAFWLTCAPLWLASRREIASHLLLALIGVLIVVPTWVALVVIREYGPWWLIGAILLVAFADIAAYFAGRAFGRRKLAPNISPGKTWEGVWGAMLGVTLVALLFAHVSGRLAEPSILIGILIGMPALTLVSVAGDLLESMLKRQAGLKDSSNLLPGHGGVLDRIDSHAAALPMLALLLLVLRGSAP